MKRILVTGGAGYIGSHTSKALARAGYEPIVLDNLSTGHAWAVKWGPLFKGELRDGAFVRNVIQKNNVEAVIHFAASAYVGESMQNPQKYFDNNVVTSLSLLNAMLDCGVRNIVFSSTCATYGNPVSLPLDENHPQAPVNPYGASKLFVENALHWYGEAYGFNAVSLRYFNAAGADPEGETGEHHNPETHLTPLAIQAALGLSDGVHVFGTDYPTPDGTAIRDYIHVTDLADAHVKALAYLERGGTSTPVNLGTGRGHSVHELIQTVERVGCRPVPVTQSERRKGDPAVLQANPDKARHLLGWTPQHPELDEIVSSAWNWHSSQAETVVAA